MIRNYGFVFAVSGDRHGPVAVNAAQSLRAVCPDAQIDLFCDTDVPGSEVFDQVHYITRSWFRPKFEALRESRFDRTIYLDADMFIVGDPTDIFDVLDRFDFAGVHNQHRNSDHALQIWRQPIPAAFPQINGGLIAIKRSEAVLKLIDDVEQALIDDPKLRRDQAPMRELLYLSDLRVAILPPEYNLMQYRWIEPLTRKDTAPRILHLLRFNGHIKHTDKRITRPQDAIGPVHWHHVQRMLAADRTLDGTWDPRLRPLADKGLGGYISKVWRKSLLFLWQLRA